MAFNKVVYLAALALKIEREQASALARCEIASASFLVEHPQETKKPRANVAKITIEKDFTSVRKATKNDYDNTRTKAHTIHRRIVLGRMDPSAKADRPKNKRQRMATCGASGSKCRARGTSQPLLDDDHVFRPDK